MGDIIAPMTFYDIYVSRSGNFIMDASLKVKLGTADEEKGLGTGETDYSVQSNAYQYFDNFSLSATIGYKVRGDPRDYNLQNVWFASLGANYRFDGTTRGGIAYDYRQSSFANNDPAKELSVYVSYRLNEDWRMQLYALTGLSDISPDFAGGGVQILFINTGCCKTY
jgi:hypothetical protein